MWWLILAGPSDLGHLCLTMATPSSLHITLGTQTQRRPAHSTGEWLETDRWRWSQSCWPRSTAARSCLPRASPWWQYIYTISTQYLHNVVCESRTRLLCCAGGKWNFWWQWQLQIMCTKWNCRYLRDLTVPKVFKHNKYFVHKTAQYSN